MAARFSANIAENGRNREAWRCAVVTNKGRERIFMSASCPVLTPTERQVVEILNRTQQAMLDAVYETIDKASREATDELVALGQDEQAATREFYTAVVHQKLFLRLCGADTETFMGGNPDTAAHIIENARNIAAHYWSKNP
jgi:hypothetical protein